MYVTHNEFLCSVKNSSIGFVGQEYSDILFAWLEYNILSFHMLSKWNDNKGLIVIFYFPKLCSCLCSTKCIFLARIADRVYHKKNEVMGATTWICFCSFLSWFFYLLGFHSLDVVHLHNWFIIIIVIRRRVCMQYMAERKMRLVILQLYLKFKYIVLLFGPHLISVVLVLC